MLLSVTNFQFFYSIAYNKSKSTNKYNKKQIVFYQKTKLTLYKVWIIEYGLWEFMELFNYSAYKKLTRSKIHCS